ncbi:hypothetical protein [Methylorubrum extorquens]|uniref:hypothetical protein n=1 Tax=Methylorubrum extorquens TaxID=408 RepID=UPI002237407D|nr:hypothetical protein [Methylorubrum extorquens]UYW30373.1 hypothetical protein OKB92_15310 [Methylorubrum extorquens]
MALYGPSTATASVTANTNLVTIAGMGLTIITPGMTINFGARDRKIGDAWILGAVTPNGTNGGTVTTAGSIPTGYSNAPFVIDTTGYLGTDASYAAATSLSLLQTLATLFGPATNLYSGARQIVLDKLASTALGRIAFAIAGRNWGDLAHREYSYTPTGGSLTTTQTLALRAFPDGSTPIDALLVDLSSGTVDFRQNEIMIASAATVDLSSAPAGRVTISGAAGILSFGAGKNLTRLLRFTGAATLTHNATSLVLLTAANIVTAPGDTALATSDAAGNWTVRDYQRANGRPLITPTMISGNSGPTDFPAGTTRYFTHALVGFSQSQVYTPAGRRIRLSNLRVVGPQAPGWGQSWKFTLQKLFSDTALTCTISGTGSNQATDATNSVIFEPNDRWSLRADMSAGAASLSSVLFSMDVEVLS